jgi:uncharacterized RDD family membrane protein YckC
VLIALAITLCGYVLHEIVIVGVTGRSFGKTIFGLRVIRVERDAVPGIGRAALRALIPTAILVFFFPAYPVPYLIELLTPDGRWPNDALAGTCVVVHVKNDEA